MTWPNPSSHFRLLRVCVCVYIHAAVNISFGSVIRLYTLLVSAQFYFLVNRTVKQV